MLYFSHYLKSFKFTDEEIMAKVQHQYQEVKMDFNSKNLCRKKVRTKESINTGPGILYKTAGHISAVTV